MCTQGELSDGGVCMVMWVMNELSGPPYGTPVLLLVVDHFCVSGDVSEAPALYWRPCRGLGAKGDSAPLTQMLDQ
ncbi:unnamed protein product [Danaus chrysippus]|uniref:(African queen) hypothetical protein n=1 Tax=Danaus chrysippus TaxID=151541 RepID=A0A8J2QZC2_9NEOP|nr:unnamed protein product [Danaus chrysippus]